MKATKNLPKQSEIEEFLGKEFFPKYPLPISLPELVDLMQLEFEVTDDDRNLPLPSAHGCGKNGGTIFECLIHFALLRLQTKRIVKLVGMNTYVTGEEQYIGKVDRRSVNEAKISLKILMSIGMDKDTAIVELAGKWDDDVVITAANKVYDSTPA